MVETSGVSATNGSQPGGGAERISAPEYAAQRSNSRKAALAAATRADRRFLASLLLVAPLLFGIAVLTSIALYTGPRTALGELAPVAGLAAAIVVGVWYASWHAAGATPEHVNPRQYGELTHWWSEIDAHFAIWCSDLVGSQVADGDAKTRTCACLEAAAHADFVGASLGLIDAETIDRRQVAGQRWASGAGYVELWERLHRAEEALFLAVPVQQAVAFGLYDEMRLSGSRIEQRDALLDRLRVAVTRLGGAAYLESGSLGRTRQPDSTVQGAEAVGDEAGEPARAQARLELRNIRRSINEYRDSRRDGLVRSRNNLCWTGSLTALVTYALLALAMVADPELEVVYSAVALFLVGAVIGLFNHLKVSADADGNETEEDFGLTEARLLNAPILSGLAALGGVFLSYLAYGTIAGADRAVPPLTETFNLTEKPQLIAVAALFGLTPQLLIRRLQVEANRYKEGLRSTNVQESGPSRV